MYKLSNRDDDVEDKAKSLLDINPEGRLLNEIRDVLDEITMLISIMNKQQRVFKQFRKHVEHMIAPSLSLAKEIGTAKQKKVTGDRNTEDGDAPQKEQVTGDTDVEDGNASQEEHGKGKKNSNKEGNDKAEKDVTWTLEFVLDLSLGLDDRILELTDLKESSEHTEKAVSCVSSTEGVKFTDGRSWTGS
jgi:hypothetical protein